MENWGLITYRTTAVLFDEKTSDSRYKNRVAYVVAHGKVISRRLRHLSTKFNRTCPPVVRKPCYHGLVVRAMAKRGVRLNFKAPATTFAYTIQICHLGWLVRY